MASKDEEKMKRSKDKDEKESKPQFLKQQSVLSVLGGEVAGIAAAPAHQKEDDDKLEDSLDKIFHAKQKTFDYANLGGGPRSGIAQVDSASRLYNPTKQSKDSVSKTKKPEKEKVKQNVPQIGALGAFAALSGGLIGGVSSASTAANPEVKDYHEKKSDVTPEPEKKPEYERKTSVLSGIGQAEIDTRRKFSSQLSTASQADDEDENAPTVDMRGHDAPGNWESDEGHHFQMVYPHAHHVMPRIRRKKKTSISSDDGFPDEFPDGETDLKKKSSGHGKRRSSKKDIELQPTIEEETKAQFAVGSATEPDEESEADARGSRNKQMASKSSMHSASDTEDGHDNKFLKLKMDKGDTGKMKPTSRSKTPIAKKSVMFSVGQEEESEIDDQHGYDEKREKEDIVEDEQPKRRRKRSKKSIGVDDRRTQGSMVKMDEYSKMIDDDDEVDVLESRDLEELAAHRMDRMSARHKITRDPSRHDMLRVRRKNKKHRHVETDGGETTDAEQKFVSKMYGIDPQDEKNFDKTPHDIFVQLSELNEDHTFWEEKSRWIKYEECKEEGAERWGRPHLSSLSFHSLINLRLSLEKALVILDYDQAKDFTNIAFKLADECCNEGFIPDEQLKTDLLRLLLIRHKFVDPFAGGEGGADKSKLRGIKRSLSRASMANLMHHTDLKKAASDDESDKMGKGKEGIKNGLGGQNHLSIDVESGGMPSASTFANLYQTGQNVKKTGIMNRLQDGTEGTITLVGAWECINEPLCVFVRLAEGIVLPNTMEVPVPVRFVFLLLTPDTETFESQIDPHEVGRSFSTMMSNPAFHNVAYQCSDKKRLLAALNEFLDSSVVLPSGDWESKNLISMDEIKSLRVNKQAMKDKANALKEGPGPTDIVTDKEVQKEKEEQDDDEYDPMKRGRYPFSGVVNDIKNRFPHYLSDFTDGFNGQAVAATIFIYFAALSGAVAFGGLTADATKQQIGVPETMIVSAVSGVIYALFSGQPLIITGLTGPILLYDTSLFNMSEAMGIDFLQWRVWIGIWVTVIAVVVAAFQGSVLVKHFSKFTKDIFASLVSLLFIFSALKKLHKVWKDHPLYPKEAYTDPLLYANLSSDWQLGVGTGSTTKINTVCTGYCRVNPDHCGLSADNFSTDMAVYNGTDIEEIIENEPNTALLSFILMFGTFMIAYGLKQFRNSHYFGRTIRRALGDFGVPIGIVFMVLVDYLAGDTYSKKLSVPFGLQTTISKSNNFPQERGWFINPFVSTLGIEITNATGTYMDYGPRHLPIWVPFMSVLPAFLLFLVLFIETEICELIMLEKSKKKGGGVHWDIVLLCLINTICGLFGGPWICAATVRGVAHVSALTVMSTNHAPGEAPHIVEVKDQRVSALAVSLLVGISVVLAAALEQVPFAVLYGVFLYMGISGIAGIQLFDRLFLMLMPVKHHPRVGYCKRVKTWKMHLYTLIQFSGLGILWAVKESPAALAFPFFVVSMIGIRKSLKFLFTEKELEHLDGPTAGKAANEDDDDKDELVALIGG